MHSQEFPGIPRKFPDIPRKFPGNSLENSQTDSQENLRSMFLGMQSQELPEFNVLGASATVLGNWPSSSADVERSFSLLSHIIKVLHCVSLLDPRNIADCSSQTWDRMHESFRGSWNSIVDRTEWDRYRKLKASDLKLNQELPVDVSKVLEWWSDKTVKKSFPMLSEFILTVIALLPSKAQNGCSWKRSLHALW